MSLSAEGKAYAREIGRAIEERKAAQGIAFVITAASPFNSAWLANLLTEGFVAAHAEPFVHLFGCSHTTVDAALAKLGDLVAADNFGSNRMTGIVDTFIGTQVDWLNAQTRLRKVVIRRSPDDSINALINAFRKGNVDLPIDPLSDAFRASVAADAAARDRIKADLVVDFNEINGRLPDIWRACTGGLPFDVHRANLLLRFDVDVNHGNTPAIHELSLHPASPTLHDRSRKGAH